MSKCPHPSGLFASAAVLLVLLLAAHTADSQSSPCTLPNGQQSQCIPVAQCPKILQALDLYKNSSKAMQEKIKVVIRKYLCTGPAAGAHACCPPQGSTNRPPGPDQLGAPPDVTDHPNLGLINDDKCGTTLSDRIFGGTEALLMEFPWMALISYRTSRGLRFSCGGSLINPRYVLTAAHCVASTIGAIVGVRLGEHSIRNKTDCQMTQGEQHCSPPVQDILAESTVAHPGYRLATKTNDIALIKLARPANVLVDNVNTICLPVGDLRVFDLSQKNVLVAGWGVDESDSASDVLLKVNLPTVPLDQCRGIFTQYKIELVESQICAGGIKGKDSCKGDSGGPLCYNNYFAENVRQVQYGIVSFGSSICGREIPGIYTRITYFMDWILDNISS